MAEKAPKKDDKKSDKKEGPAVALDSLITELLFILMILILLYKIFHDVNFGTSFNTNFFTHSGLASLFGEVTSRFYFFIDILCILFAIGIWYSLYKLYYIEKAWKASLYIPLIVAGEEKKNKRWDRVVAHLNSGVASEWRLAVLECDIMLDELLDKIGFVGGTIGDKLKLANKSDFRTLDNVWEAHRIRNAIAHEGQDFALTEREAKRIVSLYESGFREFDFI